MKILNLVLIFFFVTTISCAQKSPRKQADGKIDGVNISIDYGAPSVKGRVIWGGLENYGKVWRAGANENTTISFDKDVKIAGTNLAAGKYGFFIIPNETGDWIVIFNKKNDGWGANDYKQDNDALRANITPKFVSENQEQLIYSVDKNAIHFAWEKARLEIPVSKE
ncbi:MAG: DUF2911 domain-containing protein [Bacteroidota bacterium]